MRYLFQRKEGGNWYIKLQPPGGKSSSNAHSAHRSKGRRNRGGRSYQGTQGVHVSRRQSRVASVVHGPWLHEFDPGLHTCRTADTSWRPNRSHLHRRRAAAERRPCDLSHGRELFRVARVSSFRRRMGRQDWRRAVPSVRPVFAAKSLADDAILETYIKHKGITGTRDAKPAKSGASFAPL